MSNSTFTIPAGVTQLNGLSDVTLDSLQNKDVLVYDSSEEKFLNKQLELADISDAGTMAAEDAADYTATTDLADVALSGEYSDLLNTPALADVATSGDYNDLINTPNIPNALAVEQIAHGFAVGDLIRHDGTEYVKAQADSTTNAEVIGIVSNVADADNFSVQHSGRVTGLSGLTAGVVYKLSTSTAGAIQTAHPETAGHVDKPVLIADSTTSAIFYNMRGLEVS